MPDSYGTYGDVLPGSDGFVELAGVGAPSVSEFAVIEFAAAIGRTTDSGRSLVGDAIEIRHRMPRLWVRVTCGEVEVWRARRIAQRTKHLTKAGAAFVDAQVAPFAHSVGVGQLDRLVAEAQVRFDPEAAELERLDAAEARHFDIHLQPHGVLDPTNGIVHVEASMDAADALDLEHAIRRVASDLLACGSTEALDVRRSQAAGELARRQTALDLAGVSTSSTTGGDGVSTSSTTSGPTRTKARQVVLHVHLSEAALRSHPEDSGVDLARVEETRSFVLADQVRDWCTGADVQVTVKPVIDLRQAIAVDAHEIPDRIAERVRLVLPHCVFPYCNRPARSADLDHTEAYDKDGPPGQTSTDGLAPLCRRHHRVKTHPSPAGGTWTYRAVDPAWIPARSSGAAPTA